MNDATEIVELAVAVPLQEVGEIDRHTYLGSSDCAAVLGLGAYGATPLTVYMKKIGEQVEELDPKHQLFLMRRKRWEGPIVEMLREEFDGEIVNVNQRYADPEFPFLAAEVDFEWVDGDGATQSGEIKTCSPFAFGESQGWGEEGSSDIPVHYAAQVMFSLMVTGRQTCIVAAMVGLDSMIFYRVERDDEVIADMRARCVAFWNDHVLARIPPEPINLDDVMRLTLKMRGRPVEADDVMAENLRKLKQVRGSIATMNDEKDDLMFQVGTAVWKSWQADPNAPPKDNASILRGGIEIARWNAQSTTRIDAKSLRESEPEIAAKFSKTTTSRVLRFVKPKQ